MSLPLTLATIDQDEALEMADYHRSALKRATNPATRRHHRDRLRYWFGLCTSFNPAPESVTPNNLHAYRGTEDGLVRLDQPVTGEVPV